MTLLPAYFIFILDYGNNVRQKRKFEWFSYLSSKCVIKQWRQLKNAFGLGSANEHTVWWWFKKFYKEGESLKDEELGDQPLEVDNNQLRGSLKLALLKLYEKLPKNSVSTILKSFSI